MVTTSLEFGARIDLLRPEYFPEVPDQQIWHEPALVILAVAALPRFAQLPLKAPPTAKLELDPADNRVDVRVFSGLTAPWKRLLASLIFRLPDLNLPNGQQYTAVGEKPGFTSIEVGTIAKVEYLGHPDVLLKYIMNLQRAAYDPDLVIGFAQADYQTDRPTPDQLKRVKNEVGRIILKTTPIQTITFQHNKTYDHQHEPQPFEYLAQAMFFIELQAQYQKNVTLKERTKSYQPSRIRIGTALLASDNILRVYHSPWQGVVHREKSPKGTIKNITDARPLSKALMAIDELVNRPAVALTDLQDWPLNVEPISESTTTWLSAEVARLTPHVFGWQQEKKRKAKKKS